MLIVVLGILTGSLLGGVETERGSYFAISIAIPLVDSLTTFVVILFLIPLVTTPVSSGLSVIEDNRIFFTAFRILGPLSTNIAQTANVATSSSSLAAPPLPAFLKLYPGL